MIVNLMHLLMFLVLGLNAPDQLTTWSEPDDYTEALYAHAPDGACAIELDRETQIITITLCEI